MSRDYPLVEAEELRHSIWLDEDTKPFEERYQAALPIFTEVIQKVIGFAEEGLSSPLLLPSNDPKESEEVDRQMKSLHVTTAGEILAFQITDYLASRAFGILETWWSCQVGLRALADVECRSEWRQLIEASLLQRAREVIVSEVCVKFEITGEVFIKDFDIDDWG